MNRSEILDAAQECVCGQREQDYGSPERSFECIAAMWSAYLNHVIEPKDVAAMMALLKIARISTGHGKTDNWVDLAGYAACGGEIESAVSNRSPSEKQQEPQMITMRELVHKQYPHRVGKRNEGGVLGCPEHYGLKNNHRYDICHSDDYKKCYKCWSQPVDADTEVHDFDPRCWGEE